MSDDPFGLAEFPPPDGARERIAASIVERSTTRDPADPAPVGGDIGARARRRRPRSALVAVAIAAAAALVVGIAVVNARSDGDDGSETLSSLPSTTLADLAALAGSSVDRPLQPGEYQWLQLEEAAPYVHTNGTEGRGVTTVDTWVDSSDSGRELRSDALLIAGGSPPTSLFLADTGYDREEGPGGMPLAGIGYEALRALPTDPTQLEATISETMSTDSTLSIGILATSMLALDVTPPALRAATFEMLDALGYEPIGEAADRGGRVGVGFAREVELGIHVLVFDPGTGRPLGEYLGATTGPDDATTWKTYHRTGVVDAPGT